MFGGSPLDGRWNFNLTSPGGNRAAWLGIKDSGGTLEVWFQPTGGNVYRLKDVKAEGSHLTITMPGGGNRPAAVWELDAAGDKMAGTIKRGENTTPVSGTRAPALNRPEPKAWGTPEPLFNGKNLDGWEPIGNPANSHWTVKDGLLVNEDHGANLKTTRSFEDFKLHFEVLCPEHANSGVYLRGRYEVQLEREPESKSPPELRMGSIYGRIVPKAANPAKPGEWDTFDVTLVGRAVTVVHNGVTTIDHQEIEGITGGALDANEGEPGPFYLQGDHTGGLKFRNMTVALPKR